MLPTETLSIDAIVVEDRLRDDLGDLDALAASIESHDLIQPIVVDADNRLIAGERRLRACRQLDWREVPVRRYGDLSAAERLEVELAENAQRKGLTADEASAGLVRLANLAREVAKTEHAAGLRVESPRARVPARCGGAHRCR